MQKEISATRPFSTLFARMPSEIFTRKDDTFAPDKADALRGGKGAVIFATGMMVWQAMQAARLLEGQKVLISVANYPSVSKKSTVK